MSSQIAGPGKPSHRGPDGQEVWRVPGPPWKWQLSWAGPGEPVHLHETHRMDALGTIVEPVSGPCATLAEAQAAADTWWLAVVAAHVLRGQANGQPSLSRAGGTPA